ncbi:MAG: DUF3868 domain-containing protein, partial [Dysgonamonadaceae bacterium]|nr:DUF3868 domain-containing protein [Dysgonamonadaceae bacterium]
MKKLFYIFPAILFFFTYSNGFCQNNLRNHIQVQNARKQLTKDQLEIAFDLVLKGVEISADNQLVVSPVLRNSAGQDFRLPEIIVNGSRRHNLYKRSLHLNANTQDNVYRVSKAEAKTVYETIPYSVHIEPDVALGNASLYLIADLCGCGGSEKDHYEKLVAEQFLQFDCFDYIPSVNFVTPAKEKVKAREKIGEAFLVFEQAKWNILPNLFNNRAELAKIDESMQYVKEEPTAEITGITIKAYASPEGSYEDNMTLSKNRAKSLLDYIRQHYGLPSQIKVFSEGYGEDWDGLLKQVKADTKLEAKEQALQIIQSVGIFDGREKQLMDLNGGRPYNYMLKNLFPLLRRSEYHIEYTVPEFELAKAQGLLRSKPEMLSLDEMYRIANTYEKGSEPFNRVFQTAREVYPNDRIANLNAAAAAILDGKRALAKEILEKYKSDPEAWNNLGVIYMKESLY